MTLKKLALLANVSVSTVSKALSDSYHDINDQTRQRIRKLAKEHNYSSSLCGKTTTGSTGNIAVLIPGMKNPFFVEVARGISDFAHGAGFNVIFCNTEDDLQRENQYLQSLAQGLVDGLIVAPTRQRLQGYDSQWPCRLPLVLLDCALAMDRDYVTVRSDGTFGAFLATQHLVEKGHTQILFVGGPVHGMIQQLRLDGYLAALTKHGVPIQAERIFLQKFGDSSEYRAAERALASNIPHTAMLCVNDITAYTVLEMLAHNQIRVPEDVSVVGFDDLSSINRHTGLTSVFSPKYRLGRDAAKNLAAMIGGAKGSNVLLEPVLKQRTSVKDLTRLSPVS